MGRRPGAFSKGPAVTTTTTVEFVCVASWLDGIIFVWGTTGCFESIVAASFAVLFQLVVIGASCCRTGALDIKRGGEGVHAHTSFVLKRVGIDVCGWCGSRERHHTATCINGIVVDDTITVIVKAVTDFLRGLVDDVLQCV